MRSSGAGLGRVIGAGLRSRGPMTSLARDGVSRDSLRKPFQGRCLRAEGGS